MAFSGGEEDANKFAVRTKMMDSKCESKSYFELWVL